MLSNHEWNFVSYTRSEWEIEWIAEGYEISKRQHLLALAIQCKVLDPDLFAIVKTLNAEEFLDVRAECLLCKGIFVKKGYAPPPEGASVDELAELLARSSDWILKFQLVEQSPNCWGEYIFGQPDGTYRREKRFFAEQFDMCRFFGRDNFPLTAPLGDG